MKIFTSILFMTVVLSTIYVGYSCNDHKKPSFKEVIDRLKSRVDNAFNKQTFAVGGVMIDNRNGEIIYHNQNRVTGWLESGQLFYRNPTNHGERQAISWYWANKDRLGLPEPANTTIISSLDPCMMCAGSILASGFNVGSIDLDSGQGVNYKNIKFGRFSFAEQIKEKLEQTFGYYKIQNGTKSRQEYYGGQNVYFKDQSWPSEILTHLDSRFDASIIKVGKVEAQSSFISLDLLKDLSTLNQQKCRTILRLKQIDRNALSINLPQLKQGKGAEGLKKLLQKVVKDTPGAENAIAMIDPFGNLIMAQADTFEVSPINSAMFNIANKYYNFYFQQISSASATTVGGYRESQPYNYLPSPRNCKFVFLKAPGGKDFLSLQTFAIFRLLSSSTGQSAFHYFDNPLRGTIDDTYKLLDAFPPMYKEHFGGRPLIRLAAEQFDL